MSFYWFQAKGLDFQDYQHSPVYRAHCVTGKFLARLLRERGEQFNAWLPDNAASRFRMLRQHRTEGANALSRSMATLVWSERMKMRQLHQTLLNRPASCDALYLQAHAEASRALACGSIRAFSVATTPKQGRVIHYEGHEGWQSTPVYCDVAAPATAVDNVSSDELCLI